MHSPVGINLDCIGADFDCKVSVGMNWCRTEEAVPQYSVSTCFDTLPGRFRDFLLPSIHKSLGGCLEPAGCFAP